MNKIELIGSVSYNNKQYPVGWHIETHKVYVSMDTVDIKWVDILKQARTEKEAILFAKEYLST